MKKILFLSLLFFSFTSLFAATMTQEPLPTIEPETEQQPAEEHPKLPSAPYPSWDKIVNYATQNFPLEGKLVIRKDGYGYLKVDNRFIDTLFPLLDLQDEGFRKPPFFRRPDSPGAHISVFYKRDNVHPEEEAGQTFHFTPKKIVIVKAGKYVKYVILQVEAPDLEQLRKKYGLPEKLNGNEFHITLGKKTIRQHQWR